MRTDQIISALLSVALIIILTLAVMGRLSWLYFYGLALLSLGYLQFKKYKNKKQK